MRADSQSINAMQDRLVAEKKADRYQADKQRSDDILAGEHARQEATTARIAKLRALRETRDAAEHEAAEAEAKRVVRIKRKANLKRAEAAKGLGVRLRKA
jgi:hypothetical protein